MRKLLFSVFLFSSCPGLYGQEVVMTWTASVEQVYGEAVESDAMLPMNDLDVESGYVLYSAEVEIENEDPLLELENVRDYAAVYLDGVLQGAVTGRDRKIALRAEPGVRRLDLYAENIGRITYGPEISDNCRGLFGRAVLDGVDIENWTMTPLGVRNCDVGGLVFSESTDTGIPCFYRGFFGLPQPRDTYLDVSGWGMGEVWMNGKYMGSFWEREKQQSILLPAGDMEEASNEIVVFELKNNGRTEANLSDFPVFK